MSVNFCFYSNDFSYSKNQRLSCIDIKNLFSKGIRKKNGIYLVIYSKNVYDYSRCSVSLKSRLGNAVYRNTEKRIVKEIFRFNKSILNSLDMLVIVLKKSSLSFSEKREQLIYLYKYISL